MTLVIISPCISVFPMGFSWSFYLVQALHVQGCIKSLNTTSASVVLDARPAPDLCRHDVVSMPYCDNTHALSLEGEKAEIGREKLENTLLDWGFEMHEQMSATTFFPTLGGIIDGDEGVVRPTSERMWNLHYAFNYAINHPISSDFARRLLGHAMVALVLNRAGISVFRSMYDFAGQDFVRKMLWRSAKRECKIFIGILPLLVGDMRKEWNEVVTCSDASPDGYGICETAMDCDQVQSIGKWHERWRYKRTPPEEWKPRDRALNFDPFLLMSKQQGLIRKLLKVAGSVC